MNFIIYDTRWQKLWAHGNTEGKNGVINFPSICEYLMSATEPEIFHIVFFNANGTVRENIALVDYMRREQHDTKAD